MTGLSILCGFIGFAWFVFTVDLLVTFGISPLVVIEGQQLINVTVIVCQVGFAQIFRGRDFLNKTFLFNARSIFSQLS